MPAGRRRGRAGPRRGGRPRSEALVGGAAEEAAPAQQRAAGRPASSRRSGRSATAGGPSTGDDRAADARPTRVVHTCPTGEIGLAGVGPAVGSAGLGAAATGRRESAEAGRLRPASGRTAPNRRRGSTPPPRRERRAADDVHALAFSRALREADGDAGRYPVEPQEQGHGSGEVLAVPGARLEEERGVGGRVVGRRRLQRVVVAGAQVLLEGKGDPVGIRLVAHDALVEVVQAGPPLPGRRGGLAPPAVRRSRNVVAVVPGTAAQVIRSTARVVASASDEVRRRDVGHERSDRVGHRRAAGRLHATAAASLTPRSRGVGVVTSSGDPPTKRWSV